MGGLAFVPCIGVSYTDDLEGRKTVIEHNCYRIKTGQQLYNEGKALEEIKREEARQRQGTRTDLAPHLRRNFGEGDEQQRCTSSQVEYFVKGEIEGEWYEVIALGTLRALLDH